MPTTLIFMRHAQATHNIDYYQKDTGRYTDPIYLDAELTDEGLKQATAMQDTFKDKIFDAIYCSPMRRCRATLLSSMPSAEERCVHVVDALIEQPAGHNMCDKRLERDFVVASSPSLWNCDDVADVNPFIKRSGAEEKKAIIDFIDSIRGHGGTILLVTHYTWIYNMTKLVLGRHVSLDNCGLIEISFP
jgi:broad specificity phosphatase PhoE